MTQKYSQAKALLAVAKASFKAMLRSPSAVVFTLAFPLIFILVFGFIGGNGLSVKIGLDAASDLKNPVYQALSQVESIHFVTGESAGDMMDDLKKGRITAILKISPDNGQDANPHYNVQVYSSTASADKMPIFQSMLRDVISSLDKRIYKNEPTIATVQTQIVPGRVYRQIDFILPGMLGFSLLSTGVFGTAFLFFGLRQTLVLKRFFATPVNRFNILLGEALARLVFQLLGALFLIAIGYVCFHFTLIHGVETVLELLLLSAFGLLIFMGFGFIVSGIAKNESTIPPIANLITLPQFLLAGTFFPVDVFPKWLQPICKILPLTYLNDAMRKIAFEGQRLWNVGPQLLVLVIWGAVAYGVAIKVFRWE